MTMVDNYTDNYRLSNVNHTENGCRCSGSEHKKYPIY